MKYPAKPQALNRVILPVAANTAPPVYRPQQQRPPAAPVQRPGNSTTMQPANGPIALLRGAVQPPPVYRPQQQRQPVPPMYQPDNRMLMQSPTAWTSLSHKGIQPLLTNRPKQNPPIFSAGGEKNRTFVQAKSAAMCPGQANPFDLHKKMNIATVPAPLVAGHSDMAGNAGPLSGGKSTVAQPIQPKSGAASPYRNSLPRSIQRMESKQKSPDKQFEEYTSYLDKGGTPSIVIVRLQMAQKAIAIAKSKIPHAKSPSIGVSLVCGRQPVTIAGDRGIASS